MTLDHLARAGQGGYGWLRASTDLIGHRLTGSANGLRAELEADSLLRACGLKVERFAFSANAWSRGHVHLAVRAGSGASEEVHAVALANTPRAADVEAELLDAGNGLRSDIDALGDRARGRALLINLGLVGAPEGMANLHRSEKTALALDAGATAVVFVNNVPGHVLLTGTASIDGALIASPAVCVTAEVGAHLRERLRSDGVLFVRTTMENSCGTVDAHNVIAEIRGAAHPDDVILVGGHLDSWDLATGATDNGIGAFSIMDMARCFAAMNVTPQRTIRFVLFMGEEQGLLGSRALVAHYRDTGELPRIKAMINLDMSGDPMGFQTGGPPGWVALVDSIGASIQQADSAFEGRRGDRLGLHSDHQPFMLAGVPVISPICDLGQEVYRCYHSDCDRIDLVDPKDMVNNVRFVGRLVLALANAGTLPPPFTAEALRARLVECGLEEPLRIGGDWPW